MLAVTGPISPEIITTVAAAILLPPLILWAVMRSKLKRQAAEASAALEKLRAESDSALQTVQTKAAADAAEHARASATAAASLADLQQRFSTHREVAERRANDASQQIARLETDLAATREIAAQLPPTQSRIKDLETALAAEQGRVLAQEQAIAATNARAADFEKRMIDAQETTLKQKSELQQTLVELKKIRDEQAAYAAAGGAEAELAKAREATQQAEVKVTNLQRALKAAEARVEMVQKEFMNAMGMASAPAASGTSGGASDKKLRELEEKLAQNEAEARKRAREDGYKIAELEYRLSEALDAARAAQAPSAAPAPDPTPAPEPAPAPAVVMAPPAGAAEAPIPAPVAVEAVAEAVGSAPVKLEEPRPEPVATEQPKGEEEPPAPAQVVEPAAPAFSLPPPAPPVIEPPVTVLPPAAALEPPPPATGETAV